MPIDIPTGFAQVILPMKHASLARPASITFGIDMSTSSPDATTANEVLSAFGPVRAVMDADVTLGPVTLRVGDGANDPIVVEGTTTVLGGQAFASMPANVALLVKKRTALGGRKNRGRFYVPWILANSQGTDSGVIASAVVAARQLEFDDFLDNLTTQGQNMVILHTKEEGAGPTPAPTVVTSLQVENVVATQRRRLDR